MQRFIINIEDEAEIEVYKKSSLMYYSKRQDDKSKLFDADNNLICVSYSVRSPWYSKLYYILDFNYLPKLVAFKTKGCLIKRHAQIQILNNNFTLVYHRFKKYSLYLNTELIATIEGDINIINSNEYTLTLKNPEHIKEMLGILNCTIPFNNNYYGIAPGIDFGNLIIKEYSKFNPL